MDVLNLLKKLITIPSYCLNKKNNERELAEFIYQYLKDVLFLTRIKKQKVEGERFNIIASDGFRPKLLLIGHLDTVEPRGWTKYNPLKPTIKGNKLYGLGSMDMKGGIAAILAALKKIRETKGLMLLFYCDEEYDFKGMKKFVEEYKISPRLAVSAEPTDLKIWSGARGIIKISFKIQGQTAPASRPDQGRNAILGAVKAVKYLEKGLEKYRTKNLGRSTCNIAAIKGGLNLGRDKKGEIIISQKGDAVSDVCWSLLDIRSGHLSLNARIIKGILNDYFLKNSFKLIDFNIFHDLGAFWTEPKNLKPAEEIIKKALGKTEYLDLRQMGYQDIQMINEKMKIPAFSFGPRGANRHKPDEWVNIQDLDKVKEVYQNLIRTYCFAL